VTGPKRWTSEQAVLEELERLGDLSLEYVAAYQGAATLAAEAEATHKALRAKRVLLAKANGVKSIAEAEYVAEADEDVADAYMGRLTSAAQADALREAMRSVRTNQDGLRTAAASHRGPVVGPGYQ
jgi:hypothetical protein